MLQICRTFEKPLYLLKKSSVGKSSESNPEWLSIQAGLEIWAYFDIGKNCVGKPHFTIFLKKTHLKKHIVLCKTAKSRHHAQSHLKRNKEFTLIENYGILTNIKVKSYFFKLFNLLQCMDNVHFNGLFYNTLPNASSSTVPQCVKSDPNLFKDDAEIRFSKTFNNCKVSGLNIF